MAQKNVRPKMRAEKGVALIIVLLMLFLVSTLTAGMLFCTQSEIWTSANYKATAQARYVAEAGAQQAANWIDNYWNSNLPSDFTQLTVTSFPVTYSSYPIVFATDNFSFSSSSSPVISSNLSSSDANYTLWNNAETNFKTAMLSTASTNNGVFKNLYPNGTGSGNNFAVSAQLLQAYQQQTDSTTRVLKWKVVSQGNVVVGGKAAKAQVVQILTQTITLTPSPGTPRFKGAIYATGTGCGAVTMTGGDGVTGSYNSTTDSTGSSISSTGGDVWSAGNITLLGSASVGGNAYTTGSLSTYTNKAWADPAKQIIYTCSTTNYYGASADNSGSNVKGTTSQFDPSTQNMVTPTMPSVATNTANCSTTGCEGSNVSNLSLAPNPTGNYGDVSFSNGSTITLSAGTYNFNCLVIGGGATIKLPTSGQVVINILGATPSSGVCGSGSSFVPVNIGNGAFSNSGGSPANLELVYAGTGTINLAGGQKWYGTIYAPNAVVSQSNGSHVYGAIVCKTINAQAHVYYDTQLGTNGPTNPSNNTPVPSSVHLTEYSWSAY